MSFKSQLFFDPADIANIDSDYDSIASYLIGGDKAILDKENDTASGADDRGLGIMAIRKDSATALADTDGDYSFLQVDSSGRLRVDAEVSIEAEYAEDSAHASGDTGNYVLAVRADARPANANTSDDGDYASLFVNNSGELWVKDADVLASLGTIDGVLDNILLDTTAILADTDSMDTSLAAILVDTGEIQTAVEAVQADIAALEKAEDSAHSSGDSGIMSLAVRNDAGTSLVDTDGDYAPLSVDAAGALRVSGEFSSAPNTALANKVVTVGTTIVQLDASPLASRKRILIQNDGNRAIYIGSSDVTADDTAATGGIKLNKGANLEWELGPGVAVYAVSEQAGQTVRVLEIS